MRDSVIVKANNNGRVVILWPFEPIVAARNLLFSPQLHLVICIIIIIRFRVPVLILQALTRQMLPQAVYTLPKIKNVSSACWESGEWWMTSTPVFGDGRISTHTDPTSTCRTISRTAHQNFTLLALSSSEKSVTVQTHTHKQTVPDISTPCLLACVDKKYMSFLQYVMCLCYFYDDDAHIKLHSWCCCHQTVQVYSRGPPAVLKRRAIDAYCQSICSTSMCFQFSVSLLLI